MSKQVKGSNNVEGQLDFADMLFPEEVPEVVASIVKAEKKEMTPDMVAQASEYWWSGYNMMEAFKKFVRWAKNRKTIKYSEKVPDGLESAFKQCFDKKQSRLDGHVGRLENQFMAAYAAYKASCEKCEVECVSEDWLISHLWDDANRRTCMRDMCERRARNPQKFPLISLEDLPKRARKTKGGKRC